MSDQSNSRHSEVERILDTIRPAMQADGGNVRLVTVEGDSVLVEFSGTCLDCPSIELTFELGVTRTLKEHLSWVKSVTHR